jgi:hypothetical protein
MYYSWKATNGFYILQQIGVCKKKTKWDHGRDMYLHSHSLARTEIDVTSEDEKRQKQYNEGNQIMVACKKNLF